jgi:O-antigen ligase
MKNKIDKKIKIFTIIALTILAIILTPSFISRIKTIPDSLISVGSGNTRIQLAKEAVNLISLSPVFGVGLNRFQEIGSEYSSTGIFETNGFTAGTKSHNMILEMSAELGIPGILIFLAFIGFISKVLISKSKKNPFAKNLLFAWVSLLLISQFHPFLLTSQFRLFFLLAAMTLAI